MADDLPTRFEPNGTISLSVAQQRHRLRRPTVGELRRLWEGWELAAVDIDLIDDQHADQRETITERLATPDLAPEEKAAIGRERAALSRDLRGQKAEVWATWVRDVFGTLSSDKLPDDDEALEPWLLTVGFGAELLRHWQTVPKASGS